MADVPAPTKSPLEEAADAIKSKTADAATPPAGGTNKLSKVSGKKVIQPDDALKVRNASGDSGVRGEISLDLILLMVGALVLVIGAWWWHSRIIAANDKKWEAVTMAAKVARQKDIDDLVTELGQTKTKQAEDRAAHAVEIEKQKTDFKGKLNDYVPKSTLGSSCVRAGFVRYLDAAAAGVSSLPRLEPGAAEAPAAVDLDRVASVTSQNLLTCTGEYRQRPADILNEFDALRADFNRKVEAINAKVKR